MTRILHFSDLHLEHRFGGANITAAEAQRRREELRDALRRIVDRALDLEVDVVTVAGDLYEHEHATPATGAFLARQFARLAPRPVLIAPGNHDPLMPGGVYERTSWPANVVVFGSRRWTAVPVGEDVVVWGLGHDGPDMRQNRMRELRADQGGVTSVALFHGADLSRGVRAHAGHGPFRPEDIERSGAAFALLGHEHTLMLGRRYAYPGSPEPLGFYTEGAHFALLATARGRAVAVQPLALCAVRYRTELLELFPKTSRAGFLRDLRDILRGCHRDDIVRVVLRGPCPAAWRRDAQRVRAWFATRLRYCEIVDETYEPASPPATREPSFVLAGAS